ncbi:DUF192 domain-containing protein [Jejuia pallidilutea]|uniref:DUF192 domain-containing protein n=1 Tax=Jejuia pallidilutea TaxID=504487 RepID=A0A090W3A6_9FLAO|nr:DUF192 domain-containing protein [Jejuia pallidilutea]GAL66684.1 hypothetical protein JCM19301_3162 [Jejuia pallidilutea]GAL69944.1 hypothetical protein JCM19302_839 [Jejuia pallidilutea]GAL90955.1 hypothetical protein JCM19538_1013 [Jejuia pallidilutea]
MRGFRNFLFLVVVVLQTVLISCKEEKQQVKQTEVNFTKEGELLIFNAETDSLKVKLDIEIADTDYDIETGLMYRNGMKNSQGMLFIFEDERERFFFMKNTRIPLDLVYINANKSIISFQKNAKPFDETSLPSGGPAKYVLEVNAGMVDTWHILVNDSISFYKM